MSQPPPITTWPTVKPRDIPVLELYQLQEMEAAARLQMFFEPMEQCSVTDVGRNQAAKGRVGTQLVILVHNN